MKNLSQFQLLVGLFIVLTCLSENLDTQTNIEEKPADGSGT